MNDQIVAAFETWQNGGTQTSSLYLASEIGQKKVDEFVERHFESGTFATLEEFTSETEAVKAYMALNSSFEEEEIGL